MSVPSLVPTGGTAGNETFFWQTYACPEPLKTHLQGWNWNDWTYVKCIYQQRRTEVVILEHTATRLWVALKCYFSPGNATPKWTSKHLFEVAVHQSVSNSPYVLPLWFYVETPTWIAMGMPYVLGDTLWSYWNTRFVSPRRESRHILHKCDRALRVLAKCMLEALMDLHGRGIYHRDVKPENVLVDNEGHVWCIDFGSAGHVTAHPPRHLIGTPTYIAPEMVTYVAKAAKATAYDCKVDVWSFGRVLQECLQCAVPSYRMPSGNTPPQRTSPTLEHFLRCCMQVDPMSRWTAKQLLRHPWIVPLNGRPKKDLKMLRVVECKNRFPCRFVSICLPCLDTPPPANRPVHPRVIPTTMLQATEAIPTPSCPDTTLHALCGTTTCTTF